MTTDGDSQAQRAYRADLYAGRSVLVVGGSSGIGAGIATAFLQHGASVTVTGATEQDVGGARADETLRGATCERLDVRDEAAVNAVVGALPRLDVLVNCA